MNNKEIIENFLNQGVKFEDPQSVYIEETVKIGPNCFIGAGVRLKGNTVIASDVTIQGDAVIVDSVIGVNSVIKYFSVIEESDVGPSCEVGPFAHLRPQAKLMEKVKVGNFVEVKKSQLEKGVKAQHLTYLGDATIGEDTNIGAGTITCNYDGVFKHQTVIGKNAFIGSNTALVAPVTVGDGAMIAAGSTITRDVPADALGIVRAEQKAINGWAKNKKEKLLAEKQKRSK